MCIYKYISLHIHEHGAKWSEMDGVSERHVVENNGVKRLRGGKMVKIRLWLSEYIMVCIYLYKNLIAEGERGMKYHNDTCHLSFKPQKSKHHVYGKFETPLSFWETKK